MYSKRGGGRVREPKGLSIFVWYPPSPDAQEPNVLPCDQQVVLRQRFQAKKVLWNQGLVPVHSHAQPRPTGKKAPGNAPPPTLVQARSQSPKSRQSSGSTPTVCLNNAMFARDTHNNRACMYLRPYTKHGTMHKQHPTYRLGTFYANMEGFSTFWEVSQVSLRCVKVRTSPPILRVGNSKKHGLEGT